VPKQVNVGIEAFNQTPQVLANPTTDRDALALALGRLRSSGGTATGEAIQTGTRVLQQAPALNGKKPPSAIVLLSDGKTTTGRPPVNVAAAAGKAKVPIYTVALGTNDGVVTGPGFGGYIPVPPDPDTLAEIARVSGGKAFTAEDSGRLSNIYKNLGSKLGSKKTKHETTAAFAIAGLVLLLGAAVTSTRFAPALP